MDERDSGVIYVTHFTLLLGLAVPIWLAAGLPGLAPFMARYGLAAGGGAGNLAWSGGNLGAGGSSDAGGGGPGLLLQLVAAGLSGVVIIGVGDTAASAVGKLAGRTPVHAGARKTVEGTLAGIGASLGAWALLLGGAALLLGPAGGASVGWWLQLLAATGGAGLLEAATSQLDNVLLPLWYLPHLLLAA